MRRVSFKGRFDGTKLKEEIEEKVKEKKEEDE